MIANRTTSNFGSIGAVRRRRADLDEKIFKYGVYLPVTLIRREPVFRYLRQLEQSERLDTRGLRFLQLSRLQKLLSVARATVPNYRDSLSSVPEISGLNDIRFLPFVQKEDLRAHPDRFRAERPARGTVSKTTGGSTGQPLTILKSHDALARELAATWRGYRWAGIHIGDRQARLWGVPFTWKDRIRSAMIDLVAHRRRCSAFSFDDAAMAEYACRLERFRPTYFYGYVSMLTAFANYFRSRGARPPIQPHCIITTSEVLTAGDRLLLEEVFETRVFNEYGCGELGTIAHECEHGRLHLNDENMIVEVVNGDRSCAPGEKGELVITELNNLAMPLIRYRTGDFGALGTADCPCGRTLGVLDHVFGRAYDFVVTRDGRRFHGEFLMYIFEEAQRHRLGIAQFQVTQETVSDFRIRIVPGPDFNPASKEAIVARMQQYLGRNIRVVFETVGQIPREPSGKMRVIVGMMDPSGTDPAAQGRTGGRG